MHTHPRNTVISIQLAVSDIRTTEAFYAGILELPIRRALTAPGAPEHLVLEHEGWNIIFVEEDAVAWNHPFLQDGLANFPKGIGLSLHFTVRGIEEIADAIAEEDLKILYPLQEQPYRLKDLWCYDPDGYLVVLEERVS